MDESIFEYLERTRAVDYALAVLAVVGPLVVAAILRWGRSSRFVRHVGPDWWLWLVAGPLVFLLWRLYNSIMDRFGLDSVDALILNASLFLCVGLALALARIWLWRNYYLKTSQTGLQEDAEPASASQTSEQHTAQSE
jgi:hypothetical protein